MSRIKRRAKEAAAACSNGRVSRAADLFNEALDHGSASKVRRIFEREGVPITGGTPAQHLRAGSPHLYK